MTGEGRILSKTKVIDEVVAIFRGSKCERRRERCRMRCGRCNESRRSQGDVAFKGGERCKFKYREWQLGARVDKEKPAKRRTGLVGEMVRESRREGEREEWVIGRYHGARG